VSESNGGQSRLVALCALVLAAGLAADVPAQEEGAGEGGPFGKEAKSEKLDEPKLPFRLDHRGARSFTFFDGDPSLGDAPYVIAIAGGAEVWFGDYYLTARNVLIWTDGPVVNSGATETAVPFPYAPYDPVAVGSGIEVPAMQQIGGVSLLPGAASADALGVLREIYAVGDVYIEQRTGTAKNVFQAERALFNVIEDRSLIVQGELRTDLAAAATLREGGTAESGEPGSPPIPIVFRAAEIRGVAKGLLLADNAELTTCTFAEPGYHIAIDRLIYEERATETGGRFTGAGNQLVIHDTPLLGFPYLEVRTGTDSPFPLISADIGGSSQFGFFLETRWGNPFQQAGIDFNEWAGIEGEFTGNWFVDINFYSARGLGLGAGIVYETKGLDRQVVYEGETSFFFINDISGDDETSDVDNSGFRARFKTLNRVYLPEDWRLDTEIHYVSDKNFLREFLEDEADEEKEPETVAYLRKLDGDTAVTTTLRYRLNTWQTQTEYLPQATYDVISRPIAEFETLGDVLGQPSALRLYWTHRSEAAFVNRLLSDDLDDDFDDDDFDDDEDEDAADDDEDAAPASKKGKGKGGKKPRIAKVNGNNRNGFDDDEDDVDPGENKSLRSQDAFLDARERQFRAEGSAFRIDEIDRFNLPFTVGPVGVDPYFENRITFWAGDAEIDGGGGGFRESMTIGFNASTQFWKTIHDYESEYWNIHGLRHLVIPTLRYRYTFLSTMNAADLVPYDSVERHDVLHVIVPGVRNRYQTKRMTRFGRETVTFLDIDIQQPYIIENEFQSETEDEQIDDLGQSERIEEIDGFGDLWIDIRYRPDLDYYLLERSYFRNTIAYNWEEGQLDQYRIEFTTEPGPDFYARVSYSFAQAGAVSPTLALDGYLLNRQSNRDLNSLTFEFAYQMTRRWEFAFRQEYRFKDSAGYDFGEPLFILRRRTHDWLFELAIGSPGAGEGAGIRVMPLAFARRSGRDRFQTALSDGYDLTPVFDAPEYSDGIALPLEEPAPPIEGP
jgi:hypothetical protein